MPELTNGDFVSAPYSVVKIRTYGRHAGTGNGLLELAFETAQGSTLICLTEQGVTQLRACLNEHQADLDELKGTDGN
jgi:hypothetical protein